MRRSRRRSDAPEDRSERRRRAGGDGHVHRPWLWALGGGIALLVGLAMSLGSIDAWADRGAYGRATPCAEGRTDDCVVDTTAVVERRMVQGRRIDEYLVWLRLDRPELARVRAGDSVEIPEPDEIFDHLTPGREVVVRLWEGRVARIEVPGVALAETEHSPLTESLELLLGGLMLLGGGAFGVVFANSLRREHGWRRAPAPNPFRPRKFAPGPTAAAMSVMGLVVAWFLVVSLDVYSPAALLAVPGVAIPLWLLVRRSARRAR